MKTIGLDEMKSIQIDILNAIDDFCVKNKIRYTLYFGSLLGAVRHKGYIPWDDDIDIALPRKDYEKFISTFKHEYLKVYDYRYDVDYSYPFAKVADTRTLLIENVDSPYIGINIDVFPIDSLYDTLEESVAFTKSLEGLKKLYRIKLVKPSPKNTLFKRIVIRIARGLFSFVSIKNVNRKICERVLAIHSDNSKYVGMTLDPEIKPAVGSIVERSVFDNYIDLLFENRSYKAIADYDRCLRQLYGDYMVPPSGKMKRSPHTLNSVYWKDL